MRAEYQDIFKDGDFCLCDVQDELLYYKRQKGDGCIYVAVNNGAKRFQLKVSKKYQNVLTKEIYQNQIEIQPYSYQIFTSL